ncbi:MAG: TIGR00730 family Rossman fold protein [Candidatus Liptonbacteria bacterium]|nr:TIGR00730 family Rossman fold protein [Candidatus Liptonbacteria bacterium]
MDNSKIKRTSRPPKSSLSRLERSFGVYPSEVSPWRIFKIMAEFVSGFEFLKKCEGAVSFFGTARGTFDGGIYEDATKLAKWLSEDGFTIITGGGPGIMEAANRGAYEAGGRSIGIDIKLPMEQRVNPYVKESEAFKYFFVRKVMLSFASQVYIFYPGGFGTLDELFEMITLVQTGKIDPIPIILVGKRFWQPLVKWIKDELFQKNKAVDLRDFNIFYLVDNSNEAYDLIRKLKKEKRIAI